MKHYDCVPPQNLIYKSSGPCITPLTSRVLGYIKTLVSNLPPTNLKHQKFLDFWVEFLNSIYSFFKLLRGLKATITLREKEPPLIRTPPTEYQKPRYNFCLISILFYVTVSAPI